MPDPTNPDQPEAGPGPSEETEAPASTQPVEPVGNAPAAEPPSVAQTTSPPAGSSRFAGARRLWKEATASTGARVATIVALALATVVVIGGLTSVAVALARHGDDNGAGHRMGQASGQVNGKGGVGGRQKPGGGSGPGLPGNGQHRPAGSIGGGTVGPGSAGALHGEFTQAQPAATYLFQRGAVTAVSATSMTVKSSDGFTARYAVTSSTRVRGTTVDQLKVGTSVMVIATKEGASADQVRVLS